MLKQNFLLRPDITFLNHGSYGACPRAVFEVYQNWQRELEMQPVEFLARRAPQLLETARAELAAFLNTGRDNLVLVSNTTTGINTIARSLQLGAGDEILATDHEYGAVDRTWKFLCGKSGASYVRRPMSLPVTSQAEWVEEFWQGVTPRTRVISLSHITSATALIFPIAEICRRARQTGILTVIDGAHAPGQIELNLTELEADFYVGNCHKWLCAPKGAAFLYAAPTVQDQLEPLVVSWGWESVAPGPSRFVDWQEWQGTRDIAAFLSIPAAINFQAQHDWPKVRQTCHALLTAARHNIDALTGLASIYPDDSLDWYSQMAVVRIPTCDPLALKNTLWDDYQIEIPIIEWNDQLFIRISVQAYNTPQDLERLIEALSTILKRG